jgi:putative DNA primase/helicase
VEWVGEIRWTSEAHGFATCPGKHLHTTGDSERDCEIHLDGSPTLHCFHNHCTGIIAGTNHELRSRIGKAEQQNPYPSRNAEAAREFQAEIKNADAHDRGGSSADDETLSRLAAMSPLEYERKREAEAERLGCRASVLDSLVKAKRPSKPGNDTLQGQAVTLSNMEPWPEPVNGADVLEAVAERIGHYVVMLPSAADVIALWCAHTHCYKSFMHTPRLVASSAEKQSGKTTLRDVCAEFVARPILTENTTCAVLFRLVSGQFPTLLADEYDSWIKDNEELRGLLNAGHRRGAIVHRCEGEDNEVRGFAVFAPVMLCGIGALPGTLHDRSIVFRMARAKRGEIQARFDSRHVEVENELRRKLARWIADYRARIEACEPVLPETAFNRLADNWRPLFALAEIAGGQWPKRCADAFAKLTSSDDLNAQGVGTMLLFDIDGIFKKNGIDQIPSADLAESLAEIEGRPWAEWGRHRKPISPNQLANQLRHFEVTPDSIKFGDKTLRGYRQTDFKEAFDRYLSQTPVSGCNSATTLGKTPDFEVQPDNQRSYPENGLSTRESCTVAPCREGEAENEADKQAEPVIDKLGVARL